MRCPPLCTEQDRRSNCFSLCLVARAHPWSTLPLGGVHGGRGLPRCRFHPRESLLLLPFLPVVPWWEVPRRWQRVRVRASWRAHQHASPGQRWRKSSRHKPRGLWTASAGQCRLSGRWFGWCFIKPWKYKTSNMFSLLLSGLNCAFIIRRLGLVALNPRGLFMGVLGFYSKEEQQELMGFLVLWVPRKESTHVKRKAWADRKPSLEGCTTETSAVIFFIIMLEVDCFYTVKKRCFYLCCIILN